MSTRSRICIVGAGAIGGFIGTRLALGGEADVSAVARGATLSALERHGWRLRQGGELLQAPVRAVADARELGPQDIVIVAVKGHAMSEAAASVAPLLGPETIVVPAMNGVPWWFGHGLAVLGGAPLESVDPGGRIGAAIPFRHVVGCVVHASTSTSEPGLVEHQMGARLIVGEPAGGTSPRVAALVERLGAAGFDAAESPQIRHDVWYKLWGNLTMNPLSAVTGATIDRILADPLVLGFCSEAMREASCVGAAIGCAIDQTPEDRHQVTRRLGAFRSSMLQDVDAGRAIELDPIVGAVREIAARVGIATPSIDTLYGITRLFARVHGLYPMTAADEGSARGASAS
ncbi:2-dehydropantoate 2-reductase [Piscinibacter koreensis]|uniref:2-dehydropantoate 2-reductase n=1 Tax=Piscinibacter koreensis TaxID=2742824 RepID=A0A7Y6TX25_9BURK|nr:2-dehydropantoate 2-reductase [Schlegelella koreensis]NUZ06693.1 2-dehydropantoate 2-reductase [Schlegelella koreensis]